ncbi:MAG: hypothetical protein U0132_13365 [Gemmatimonadaceae bacterium]
MKPDHSVTYQRDVVIVQNGPNVIRSGGVDGVTWVIDARAGRNLSVGKIAFVTGQCVGRVLGLSQKGDDLTLTLGPVELTDIFKELHVSLNQPLSVADGIELAPPRIPNLKLPVEGDDAALPDWAAPPNTGARTQNDQPLPAGIVRHVSSQAVAPGIPQRLDLSFKTRILNRADGPAIELAHEADGVRLVAQAQLRLKAPRLEFFLDISSGKIREARVVLRNAAGLRLAFDSAVNEEFAGNIKWFFPAGGVSIPISANAPLSVNIRQDIWVQTAFSAKQSVYSAEADIDLNADVGFTFQNGSFHLVGPTGLSVRKTVSSGMSGVSVGGRTGVYVRQALTVTGGLGVWEFSTGPSFSFGTALDASMGASEGEVQCKGANLSTHLRAGVGWTIPPVVAKFVNFFLRVINVKQIPDHGGLYTPWTQLKEYKEQTSSPICSGPRVAG